MILARRSHQQRAAALVAQMSVDEQALLLSGDGWWRTHAVERLGIPSLSMADGPHGLRKSPGSEAGLGKSVPATCFPTAAALAASWNLALMREVGAALGREAQAADVQLLLGPGVNLKRSPLGGRNFEYFSEDPLLSGRLAAAYIDGVQGQGVGTSLKHFAVNNQETERMSTSSDLDERTLHEIYLPAFEMAVREARPWTVMGSYNLVNGTPASEHTGLLLDILRGQWGFEGFVVSDWGAIEDRVRSVAAGTNLEMPGSGEYHRHRLVAAVHDGRLPAQVLAKAATELIAVALQADASRRSGVAVDVEAHHALARRAAAEGIVLLKNEDAVLPLAPGRTLALIGAFVTLPRYQGAGSSQVNPTRELRPLDEFAALLGADRLLHAEGCDAEGATDDDLLARAAAQAAAADVAIVFAGLPESHESEGFDRRSIDLPAGHVRMIEAVARVQPRIVVVLMNGSAVAMPWAGNVKGIVEAWLSGQAGAGAIADVLTGQVNPSGKLAETFPSCLEQTPTFGNFPGYAGHASYGEGVFVGYRWYDARRVQPLFPFGFGLSYTRFAYTGIRSSAGRFDADGDAALIVEVTLRNVGEVAGQEVVQLYVHEQASAVPRPPNELRAFEKVLLQPGEERTLRFALTARDFAYYDVETHGWVVHAGRFELRAGGSSRDLPLSLAVDVHARRRRKPLARQSLVRDLKDAPDGERHYAEVLRALGFGQLLEAPPDPAAGDPADATALRKARMAMFAFVDEMPLSKVPAMSQGRFTEPALAQLLGSAAGGPGWRRAS